MSSDHDEKKSDLAESVPGRESSMDEGLGWKECGINKYRKKAREAWWGEDPTNDFFKFCGLAFAGPVEWGLLHPVPWINLSPPK